MNIEAQTLQGDFSHVLNDLSQREKVYHVRQLLIDLMDYTEQSDDEKLWCELNERLEELYPDYPNLADQI